MPLPTEKNIVSRSCCLLLAIEVLLHCLADDLRNGNVASPGEILEVAFHRSVDLHAQELALASYRFWFSWHLSFDSIDSQRRIWFHGSCCLSRETEGIYGSPKQAMKKDTQISCSAGWMTGREPQNWSLREDLSVADFVRSWFASQLASINVRAISRRCGMRRHLVRGWSPRR